jgi:hypothetical protein
VLQVPSVRSALRDAKVLPTSTSFSTLTFKEAGDLEDTVQPDGSTGFTVIATNEGDRSKSYTWKVTVTTGEDAPALLRSGPLVLAGHQTAEVPVQLRLEHCRKRNMITVSLDGPDERSPVISYPVLWHGGREWKASGGPSCG